MTTRVIPVAPSVPAQRQRTVLDGIDYVLVFHWSAREGRWYLDIYDTTGGNVIAGSIKLVANFPLMHSRRGTPGLPPGEMYVIDLARVPLDPGLAQLGDTHSLVYVDAADVPVAAQ